MASDSDFGITLRGWDVGVSFGTVADDGVIIYEPTERVKRLVSWRDMALPTVSQLFDPRKYFQIDINATLEPTEETRCSIKMLKNLHYAYAQQMQEVAQYDDIPVTPCPHPIVVESATVCGRTVGIDPVKEGVRLWKMHI